MFLDIQGLRCVAIFYVLCFHVWPQHFPAGYLGVDVFFVISGFLMHMLMDSAAFSAESIQNFYFRRVKRIVPTYLFIVTCTTAWALHIFDYQYIQKTVTESLTAALFASNIFNLPKHGYFDTNNQYPVFLHTWSLSVELQFYLFVPLLYFLCKKADSWKPRAGTAVLTAIGACSFLLQAVSTDLNVAHMNTLCRVWQFCIGFIVHYFKKKAPPQYSKISSDKIGEKHDLSALSIHSPCSEHGSNLKTVFCALLIILLQIRVSNFVWIHRLAATVTAGVLLATGGKSFLENQLFVYVGNISYSLYLVHWPALVFFKYTANSSTISIRDGILILQACFLLSVLVESSFKKLNQSINCKAKLFLLIVALYMCLAATISFNSNVQQPQVSAPHENYTDNITKPEEFLMSRVFDYEHMDQLNMTNTQLADYNGRLHDFWLHFGYGHAVKNNETKALKISHQVEGTGDLEVLLIGNSISSDLYYGLWPRFRSHYKRLTLVYTAATVPFQQDFDGDHSRHFLNIVKNFGRPIDLLVIRYATHRIVDDKNYIENQMRTDMQYFFDQLSLLPVKKIITGYTEYKADRDYTVEMLQKAQRANEDTSKFNFSYKKARERNLPLDKVMSTLKCDKCSIYDFSRTFCNSITDKCSVVLENGVIIYWDYMHVSAFGSFFMADDFISYLRRINVI
ncbi:unnamed protein product [Bursaphelenchus xylophilus]|uniref:(pine wood nematode) hypothetical protein n=1 Tax=Bursaphelenchus xylophilus TaxID=6326 RepID=A0A7I8WM77_BURXY|nr:unnamed protein product [Bursaphelenchus xylophilus]CAG9104440.1 unnamed protein product [Bursaphelenchus xylophilus]